jgi:hypothetical protein
MSEKLSFLFYYNWEEQFLELDNDSERWNLLHNIIKFETQRELDFESKGVKHAFLGMKHGLVSNQRKYLERAERSRINGKKHTGKNKIINEITQQVILEPKEPDNSEKVIVNIKEVNENRKEEIENGKVINDNIELSSYNNEVVFKTELEVLVDKLNSIDNWEDKLVNNGTGWVIDELIKSFQLSMEDRYAIIKIYDEMTSQRNSE